MIWYSLIFMSFRVNARTLGIYKNLQGTGCTWREFTLGPAPRSSSLGGYNELYSICTQGIAFAQTHLQRLGNKAPKKKTQLVANPIDKSDCDCQVGSNWPVGAMFFVFYFLWCEGNNPSSILEDLRSWMLESTGSGVAGRRPTNIITAGVFSNAQKLEKLQDSPSTSL